MGIVAGAVFGQFEEGVLDLGQTGDAAVLLLHSPAAEHGDFEGSVFVFFVPEIEVANGDTDDVAKGGVFVAVAQLHDISLAGIVYDAFFKPFDFEDLHFHDEPAA